MAAGAEAAHTMLAACAGASSLAPVRRAESANGEPCPTLWDGAGCRTGWEGAGWWWGSRSRFSCPVLGLELWECSGSECSPLLCECLHKPPATKGEILNPI